MRPPGRKLSRRRARARRATARVRMRRRKKVWTGRRKSARFISLMPPCARRAPWKGCWSNARGRSRNSSSRTGSWTRPTSTSCWRRTFVSTRSACCSNASALRRRPLLLRPAAQRRVPRLARGSPPLRPTTPSRLLRRSARRRTCHHLWRHRRQCQRRRCSRLQRHLRPRLLSRRLLSRRQPSCRLCSQHRRSSRHLR